MLGYRDPNGKLIAIYYDVNNPQAELQGMYLQIYSGSARGASAYFLSASQHSTCCDGQSSQQF